MVKPDAAPYRLLDSGNLRKLEQIGAHLLVRPALNAIWHPSLSPEKWAAAEAVCERDSSGSGFWKYRVKLPESWLVEWGGFTLRVKPTGFGHLGFFAEQYRNWEYFRHAPALLVKGAAALNLFGYSGIGSMAMAQSGASVCHLDASRGMTDWGRSNLPLNFGNPPPIRWIVDDVMKFVRREERRGSRYNLIALDPPSFGRGAGGEVWKIEQHLPALLEICAGLRCPDSAFTVVLSCHSAGFSLLVLERLLRNIFGSGGELDAEEMTVPESSGRELPAGFSVRYTV